MPQTHDQKFITYICQFSRPLHRITKHFLHWFWHHCHTLPCWAVIFSIGYIITTRNSQHCVYILWPLLCLLCLFVIDLLTLWYSFCCYVGFFCVMFSFFHLFFTEMFCISHFVNNLYCNPCTVCFFCLFNKLFVDFYLVFIILFSARLFYPVIPHSFVTLFKLKFPSDLFVGHFYSSHDCVFLTWLRVASLCVNN